MTTTDSTERAARGPATGSYQIQAQERIVFGQPAERVVPAEAERLGARRVFVTSTRSLATLAAQGRGPLPRIEQALGARHAGTFAAFRAHSPREDVLAVAQQARAAGADLLVAVGGGSVIDGTKAALAAIWCGLERTDEFEALRTRPGGPARAIVAPPDAVRMLSVSTTLSAADFTAGAGVTDSATNSKQSLQHRLLAPQVAVLDPACTLDTPLPLLLATGIRSVDHAIESFLAPKATPPSEWHSLRGLELLARALPAIHRDPADLAARAEAQLGMWQAIWGSAVGPGTGASHGIGYALGATFGIAHGHTSCVMLPAVLRWSEPVNAARQQVLARAMGAADGDLARAVAQLVRGLGQPGTLPEVGVTRDALPEIARRALDYPPVQAHPRPIRSADDVMEILALAWQGV